MILAADQYRPLGKTGLRVPPIVFGTSALGDERRTTADQTKREICVHWFRHVEPPVAVDTAGRYGAGRALEIIGKTLERLEIGRDEVIISDRLGWHDAAERIGYDGMFECWDEGCRLLGAGHAPQLVSVDGPDRYLAAAGSPADRDRRLQDLLDAYRALGELKTAGKVIGVGAVASDWRVIREIVSLVELDWIMLCGSLTIMRHPPEVLELLAELAERRVAVVNSGLLHGGFLTGGRSLDGRVVRPDDPADRRLAAWRKSFVALCEGHGVTPVEACVQFGLSAPGVAAARLDTSHPDRVAENVRATARRVPSVFWESMKEEGLIAEDYPYVGSSPSLFGRGPG
jgi:D-threo-aldose 1-dehydrogenase